MISDGIVCLNLMTVLQLALIIYFIKTTTQNEINNNIDLKSNAVNKPCAFNRRSHCKQHLQRNVTQVLARPHLNEADCSILERPHSSINVYLRSKSPFSIAIAYGPHLSTSKKSINTFRNANSLHSFLKMKVPIRITMPLLIDWSRLFVNNLLISNFYFVPEYPGQV